ncbi:MAG: NAD(P)(+) transhydrogenase (Re/Si-specific) subunit beta [Spirochaetales bacterium]|nr:NAD(P)(+) transhydrogenase (Re/Si-specific) subunit beta [Spirochaetales bacterium]
MTEKAFAILIYLISSVLFIVGIKRLASVKTARQGNFLAALGMLFAIGITLFDQKILRYELIFLGMGLGALIGAVLALRIAMTGMPQMVALLNGLGGGASLLVAVAEFEGLLDLPVNTGASIFLSILIGGVTLTGSLVAFGKLQGLVTEKAVVFPLQHPINALLILCALLLSVLALLSPEAWAGLRPASGALDRELIMLIIVGLSLLLGILLVIPIGGADMPVVISLLNSYSGIAAATTGFILKNNVLIITGSLVGASGIILTQIMCKSMNRSLMNVLLGGFGSTSGASPAKTTASGKSIVVKEVGVEEAAMVFDAATSVIIVPGYGMAVAQAQHVVKELTDLLSKRGATVKFAIHPVAGRMPGHMNVLLADASVPYEQLFEMDDINDEFASTDVALIIGANDVTNPAARHDQSSPIYGMPILNCDKARTVVVVKRSLRPGYAGIDNELYGFDNTLMYLGDAKEAISKLISEIKSL